MKRTPMKRTGFAKAAFKAPAKRKPIKSRGPKMTPIRKAAQGQECTMQIPGICNGDPATVVLCHSNQLSDGKGIGLKAPDTEACFGCSSCHDVLDGRCPRPAWMSYELLLSGFESAKVRTHEILRKKGLME